MSPRPSTRNDLAATQNPTTIHRELRMQPHRVVFSCAFPANIAWSQVAFIS
jgi:hypothetical protein